MATRRGATGLAGVIVIDKPADMTSHDVVAAVRRATGEGRVGHAGTLDPMATGVLVVLVGPYTRLERYLSGHDKGYSATIAFGSETDTDDAEGQVVRTAPVSPEIFEADRAEQILHGFVGPSEQQPPAYSAIKMGGLTSHEVARAGGELALAPRAIVVHDAHLQDLDADTHTWDVDFLVSKGTYIRALARDIGRAAGSAAHLSRLRRTHSGSISIDEAIPLESVAEHGRAGTFAGLFCDASEALGFPVLVADSDQAEAVACGRPLALPDSTNDETLFSVLVHGALRAVYRLEVDRLVPDMVLGVTP